jgi:hypothetical protein
MMAKATSKSGAKTRTSKSDTEGRSKSTAVAERRGGGDRRSGDRRSSDAGMGEAFIKLLQSPLVAELVAVAATAALAALAEQGFTAGGEGSRGKRAGKAVKEAGKAAAAAVGRRLSTEIDEIKKAATGGAKG